MSYRSIQWSIVSAQDFTFALVGNLRDQLFLLIIGATAESMVEIDLNNAQQLPVGLIIIICAVIGFGIVTIIATWTNCIKEI